MLYRIPEESVVSVLRDYAGSPFEKLILPRVQEATKEVTALKTAADIVKTREQIKVAALEHSRAKVGSLLVIEDLVIENVALSKELEQAIEAKMVQQQEAEKAMFKMQQAKTDAETLIIKAKADAESIRIQGEALEKASRLVELKMVEKWNGVAPQVVGAGSKSCCRSDPSLRALTRGMPGRAASGPCARPPSVRSGATRPSAIYMTPANCSSITSARAIGVSGMMSPSPTPDSVVKLRNNSSIQVRASGGTGERPEAARNQHLTHRVRIRECPGQQRERRPSGEQLVARGDLVLQHVGDQAARGVEVERGLQRRQDRHPLWIWTQWLQDRERHDRQREQQRETGQPGAASNHVQRGAQHHEPERAEQRALRRGVHQRIQQDAEHLHQEERGRGMADRKCENLVHRLQLHSSRMRTIAISSPRWSSWSLRSPMRRIIVPTRNTRRMYGTRRSVCSLISRNSSDPGATSSARPARSSPRSRTEIGPGLVVVAPPLLAARLGDHHHDVVAIALISDRDAVAPAAAAAGDGEQEQSR